MRNASWDAGEAANREDKVKEAEARSFKGKERDCTFSLIWVRVLRALLLPLGSSDTRSASTQHLWLQ